MAFDDKEREAAKLLLSVVYANHACMADLLTGKEPGVFYDGWDQDGNLIINDTSISFPVLFRAATKLLVIGYGEAGKAMNAKPDELIRDDLTRLALEE